MPERGDEMIGQKLAHYQVVEKLGQGGMGVVYKALDTHLDRFVALKLLPPERVSDPERKKRFVREAKAASALNHPNIITIHDIDSAASVDFMVMEYVEGRSLAAVIASGPVRMEDVLDYAVQIASALAAAHAAGIVHRDIKPANIMVSGGGRIKVLDFGLAKLSEHVAVDSAAATLTAAPTLTQGPVMMGTVAYMSPEQAEGKPVDARTDVFSLGVVLYEMLAGRRPFPGDSQVSILTGILHRQPEPLKTVRPEVPDDLQHVVERCLEKDRERRYPTGVECVPELERCRARLASPGLGAMLRRPRVAIPAAVLLVALAALGTWWGIRSSRERWARTVALPEIAKLVAAEKIDPAFRLGRQAERYLPRDPELARLREAYQARRSVRSDPPGAEVAVRGYLDQNAEWFPLGVTPIDNVPVPRMHLRWKAAKPGYEPVEGTNFGFPIPDIKLFQMGSAPAGMVWVVGGDNPQGLPRAKLDGFWLDRHEVTNRQFQQFVDQGGYRKREYWKHDFSKDGKTLSWEQAMAEFHDATGRPGPFAWQLGAYPDGQEDFPVRGVSWYEAAAYAEFAGKSLPTVYHWYRGAVNPFFADILAVSNFGGKGPVRVGSTAGISPYGAFDMAGNVREWCWNQAGHAAGARRYIPGGAWSEPSYVFTSHRDAAPPFDRSAINGFRCAKYPSPPADAVTAPIEVKSRDYAKEKPVSDEVLEAYRSLYSYNKTELKAAVEAVDDTRPHWRREKVSFNAAYGNERVTAHLFLPKSTAPPYQTVVYFPGASAQNARSFDEQSTDERVEYLVRIGRAVVYPIYKGMYERRDPSLILKDRVVFWSKDFGRTIDYLESRQDIDRTKLAFYGYSLGGIYGPVLTAIDGRIKASIQIGGGLVPDRIPPEVDPLHYAPRAKEPALLIVGRYDFVRPVECCQAPMLRLLGAPQKDKRMVQLDSGHRLFPSEEMIKETLDWLDRYLGPVKSK